MTSQKVLFEGLDAKTLWEKLDSLKAVLIQEIQKSSSANSPDQEEYLSRAQVSQMLCISLVTVHSWTNKGIIPAYRIGNRTYYKRSEIDAAMTQIKKRRQQ